MNNNFKNILLKLFPKGKNFALLVFGLASLLFAINSVSIYLKVRREAFPLYQAVNQVPQMPVAIVFGAGVGTVVLSDRVQTAVSLYKSGKVKKILMTGDNGHAEYDEPRAMRLLAMASGIPSQDITCDYAGFRTYDSLYRALNVFDVRNAILVSQAFHLPRAMYIARELGLSVVGIDASRHSYGIEQCFYELREIAAIETAWLDLLIQRKPRFLGKKEPIFSDVSG